MKYALPCLLGVFLLPVRLFSRSVAIYAISDRESNPGSKKTPRGQGKAYFIKNSCVLFKCKIAGCDMCTNIGNLLKHLTCNVRVSLLNESSFTFQRNNCCALFIQLDLQHVFF